MVWYAQDWIVNKSQNFVLFGNCHGDQIIQYHAAICSYRVYKIIWQPEENEILLCSHEMGNNYDIFAIKTCKEDQNGKEIIVGHLPLELS